MGRGSRREWLPARQAEIASAGVYTARPDWTHSAESAWSRIAKFQWLNRLSAAELHAALGAYALAPGARGVDLRCAQGFDLSIMASTLQVSPLRAIHSFCVERRSEPLLDVCARVLRFCPACISRAYHATFFQFCFIRRCPVHKLELLRGCPVCQGLIAYRLDRELLHHPYLCGACGHALHGQLQRRHARALQSVIPSADVDLLERWRRYVAVAAELNGGGARYRVRSPKGLYLPVQPNSYPKALIKRLVFVRELLDTYGEPPPLPDYEVNHNASLLAGLPHRRSWQANRLSHRFEHDWPHLPEDYAWYVRVYRSALNRRVRTLRAASNPPWRKKRFSSTLLIAAHYRPELVALMGWRLAWEGKLRPRAARERDGLPLLGLLEWWAFAPLRPQHVSPSVWRVALLRRFALDLQRSYAHWLAITQWMQSRRVYLVHRQISPPAVLWLDPDHPGRTAKVDVFAAPMSYIFTSNFAETL